MIVIEYSEAQRRWCITGDTWSVGIGDDGEQVGANAPTDEDFAAIGTHGWEVVYRFFHHGPQR